jgi:hypothetical protein
MPTMTEQSETFNMAREDEFNSPASRGFVRYEIVGLELRLTRELARTEARLWWKVSVTTGVFVALSTLVQLVAK